MTTPTMTMPATTTHTATGRAWSCTVRLVVADARALRPATADLFALLARVDAAASRFRPDSALSIANRRAGRPTPIPRLLVDLVSCALQAADDTDGAVDPTVGRALNAIGYDRDIAELPLDGPPIRTAAAHGWRSVRLHREAGLLTVPLGSALDLGATAKARTADIAAGQLAGRYGTAVLVELGGDLAVAGDQPDGWCVRVAEQAPGTVCAPEQLVVIRNGGLTTSTTTVRTWRRAGAAVHHIVDPRSGLPAAGPWRTVSVAAESALAANAASTAAIVRGERALGHLDAGGWAARLVDQDGAVTTTAGWPRVERRQLIGARS